MAKGFAKPQNVGKTFARLFGYLRPHLGKLILAGLFLKFDKKKENDK